MIKKLLFSLIAIITCLSASAAVSTWKIHPVFGATPTNAIDTGNNLYYLVSQNLYCYDKETSENIVYDKSNYLNDTQIQNIYYNYDKKYLLVAYANANIDIILENGKVINIPDICNALLTSAKTINHVTFNGNRVYVATAFGYVVINDEKYEIAESRIYNTNITSVAIVGNAILLSADKGTYIGERTKPHSTLDTYVHTTSLTKAKFHPLTESRFLTHGTNTTIYNVNFDENNVPTGITLSLSVDNSAANFVQPIKATGEIMALFPARGIYYKVAADGSAKTSVTLPTSVKNEIITSQESDGSWWTAGSNGIRHISIDGTTATTILDYQKINASSVSRPVHLVYNQEQDFLYVLNTGKNRLYSSGQATTFSTLAGSNWTTHTPTVVNTRRPATTTLYNTYAPVVDPQDSNTFYIGTEFEGIFKFTNFEQVAHYDWTNSPLINKSNYNCAISGLQFDNDGNLWAIQAESSPSVFVLPKEKLNSTELSAEDWITPTIKSDGTSLTTNWRQLFLISKKHNIKVYTAGSWASRMIFFKENSDLNGSYQYVEHRYVNTLDQDNKNYTWTDVFCFAEDLNGMIWVGTTNGVTEWDPRKVFNTDFRVNRIKVPRNDGTNNADYLLDGLQVNAIAVDGSNRKWIGTNTSGLLLVSPDGSEIIEHFTTANSILPSDKIISLRCNPNNNVVYVGTENGLLEYESTSTTPAETYDNVIVYPNPVRPEYTGMITIKGLMDNSLVKISDASGNVVATLQSTGGMATWDGCNFNGDRVKSGVYFVLASENEDETSSAVVAKFLVIR